MISQIYPAGDRVRPGLGQKDVPTSQRGGIPPIPPIDRIDAPRTFTGIDTILRESNLVRTYPA